MMLLALLSCGWATQPSALVPIATGLPEITDVQAIPGHPGEVVVLTKGGTAHRVELATGKATPWLTVKVRTNSEMGLLAIAFAKDFPESGHFFLHTNPEDGDKRSEVSRWSTDPATLAAPTRVGQVLELAQPYANHDGGQLQIGPDGMLYVGFGDGGDAGDPLKAGQDRSTWLGSILRLDVSDPSRPYAVPGDNPFVGQAGRKPEIWAWGLRNPWRFVLLPDGRAIIGDVGQNEVEEVTVGGAGANHGWSMWEGDRCYTKPCSKDGITMPVHTYTHRVGQSITGGVVAGSGPWAGKYLFGDFVAGKLWAMEIGTWTVEELGRHDIMPSTFGLTADGTPLVASYSGTLYRLEKPPKG
jgi:glucose/arabinose dehydrogenase